MRGSLKHTLHGNMAHPFNLLVVLLRFSLVEIFGPVDNKMHVI
jgi:hypothetical protein